MRRQHDQTAQIGSTSEAGDAGSGRRPAASNIIDALAWARADPLVALTTADRAMRGCERAFNNESGVSLGGGANCGPHVIVLQPGRFRRWLWQRGRFVGKSSGAVPCFAISI